MTGAAANQNSLIPGRRGEAAQFRLRMTREPDRG